jgi:cytochrome c-type biogenesis protein CcmE
MKWPRLNRLRRKRLTIIVLMLAGIGIAVGLALNAFRQNLLFFFSPSQVVAGEAPKERAFRIGGLVTQGSVKREADGLTVRFVVTDTIHSTPIVYKGILPDLFREGQGIVAQGRLREDGVFVANEVLAKHDESYMPPEVADALKTAGVKPPHTNGGK